MKNIVAIANAKRKAMARKSPKLKDYILAHRAEINDLKKILTYNEIVDYLKRTYRNEFKKYKLNADYLRKTIQGIAN